MSQPIRARLGIDVGGTFIDFALAAPPADLVTHKVLSERADLAGAVLRGLNDLAAQREQPLAEFLADVELIVHGTTVATNAVLTHGGARTGLLTTAGTRDALEMRRGVNEEPLNTKYRGPRPLVPRARRLPVTERIAWDSAVLVSLDEASLDAAIEVLAREQVESVAICLMHAYANAAHEQAVAERVQARLPGVYVTCSAVLQPQLGYYRRVSTTVLNSYVGPLLSAYLAQLSERLVGAGFAGNLLIMNSAGGVMRPDEIARRAAVALLSGPAAGPIAAHLYAQRAGTEHCAVIDMGGTSLDMSLVWGGEPLLTTEATIAQYALGLPVIDIRTIGAGGGSIGWLDEGGVLHMGPRSAGASPGPACYARGGTLPTCTDANVALGYLDPAYFLGGRMTLAPEAAESAIRDHIADALGISVREAAVAMYEVINATMATGIRDMIVDRALDPRSLPLVVGGGAGPVHAGMLAWELGIREVIIPRESGVFCATGMLLSDLKIDFVQSCFTPLARLEAQRWRELFESLSSQARAAMREQGSPPDSIDLQLATDVRYARQLHELTLPLTAAEVSEPERLHALFDQFHARFYGYSLPEHPLDLVNVRVTAFGRLPKPDLAPPADREAGPPRPIAERTAYVPDQRLFAALPIYASGDLRPGDCLRGPAILEHPQTTVVVPAAFELQCDAYGTLVLHA